MAYFYDKYVYDKTKELEKRLQQSQKTAEANKTNTILFFDETFSFCLNKEFRFESFTDQAVCLKLGARFSEAVDYQIVVTVDGITAIDVSANADSLEKTFIVSFREGVCCVNVEILTIYDVGISVELTATGSVDYEKSASKLDCVPVGDGNIVALKNFDFVTVYKYTMSEGLTEVLSLPCEKQMSLCESGGYAYLCCLMQDGTAIIYQIDENGELVNESESAINAVSACITGGEYVKLFYIGLTNLYRKTYIGSEEYVDSLPIFGKKVYATNLGDKDVVFITEKNGDSFMCVMGGQAIAERDINSYHIKTAENFKATLKNNKIEVSYTRCKGEFKTVFYDGVFGNEERKSFCDESYTLNSGIVVKRINDNIYL